jgi:hypothetical protein
MDIQERYHDISKTYPFISTKYNLRYLEKISVCTDIIGQHRITKDKSLYLWGKLPDAGPPSVCFVPRSKPPTRPNGSNPSLRGPPPLRMSHRVLLPGLTGRQRPRAFLHTRGGCGRLGTLLDSTVSPLAREGGGDAARRHGGGGVALCLAPRRVRFIS